MVGGIDERSCPEEGVLIYIDPDELVVIEQAKAKHWVESRGQFVRNSIRHYKDVLKAIYGEGRAITKRKVKEIRSL